MTKSTDAHVAQTSTHHHLSVRDRGAGPGTRLDPFQEFPTVLSELPLVELQVLHSQLCRQRDYEYLNTVTGAHPVTLDRVGEVEAELDTRDRLTAPVLPGREADSASGEVQEAARLVALHALDVLDTGPEQRFDQVVAMARSFFAVPVASITLIDADRQWVKAASGTAAGIEVPRDHSPCHYTIQQPGTLVITDTTDDVRASGTAVVHQGIRFYAGQPLKAPTGERVGSLCIMDTTPRRFSPDQQKLLAELGALVEQALAASGELETAAAAQQALMPPNAPQVPGYELAGRCTPDRRTDGGYFDWRLNADRLHLQIADVTGAGTSASVIAACLRTLLRAGVGGTTGHQITAGTAEGISVVLGEQTTFVTAFAATVDPPTGTVTYLAAGHGMAVILRPGSRSYRLAPTGPALGLPAPDGTGWQVRTTVVAPGETLLILSDGFLDLEPDRSPTLEETLTWVARRYRGGITAHEAVELATAWAVAQDHPTDITVLALHRSLL